MTIPYCLSVMAATFGLASASGQFLTITCCGMICALASGSITVALKCLDK